MIITRLSDHAGDFHVSGANVSHERLLDVSYNVPSWEQIADGLRPGVPAEDPEPGVPRHGWQFHAAAMDDCFFRYGVVPRVTDTQQAMVRSQSGPLAGVPFTSLPTSPLTRFDAQVFRVLLLRRLWRPLPLSASACRCGRPLDDLGHHRSACATSGVLGRRGFALESAAARVCREAGGRVTLNVWVCDLDLPPRGGSVILTCLHGVPLTRDVLRSLQTDCRFSTARMAIDTTMVPPVRGRRGGEGRTLKHRSPNKFDVRTSKSDFEVPCAKSEHLSEVCGRARENHLHDASVWLCDHRF